MYVIIKEHNLHIFIYNLISKNNETVTVYA